MKWFPWRNKLENFSLHSINHIKTFLKGNTKVDHCNCCMLHKSLLSRHPQEEKHVDFSSTSWSWWWFLSRNEYIYKNLTTSNELTIKYPKRKDDSSPHGDSGTLFLEYELDSVVVGDLFATLDSIQMTMATRSQREEFSELYSFLEHSHWPFTSCS